MKKVVSILIIMTIFGMAIPGNVKAATAQTDDVAVKATIEKYYKIAYDSWWNLKIENFDDVLDMSTVQNQNFIVALEENIFRWEYAIDNGFFEGQRERHDISFEYDTIDISSDGESAEVYVTLSGETEGMCAYPCFVAFGMNKFILINDGEHWKIREHEYDDVCLYEQSKTELLTYDEEALTVVEEENYANAKTDNPEEKEDGTKAYPYTDYSYSASRAVQYANSYCSNGNSFFYSVSGGDCTNFVSQCVSYGFGTASSYSSSSAYKMVNTGTYSTGWYAGSGGGCASWESVNNHWTYMISSKTGAAGPRSNSIAYSSMVAGDVMQIDFESDGSYDHSVICVDRANQKFAQHTTNGYRYYTDYSGSKRYYHPTFFREY